MKPVLVSLVCPKCGETEHRRVRPTRLIAFTQDRVCRSCDTRYAPPTPRRAALVFIVGGGFLLLSGIAGLAATTIAWLGRGLPDPIGMLISGGVTVLGFLAAVHGIRAMVYSGRV